MKDDLLKTRSDSTRIQILSANQELPQTTEDTFTPGILELSADQRATAEELSRLDLQLAGLYRLGFSHLPRAEEPGVGYLIAHAGRELSRGVVRLLAGTEISLPKTATKATLDNERNRLAIGTILQLPPGHPLVTKWFQVNSTFAKSVHFQQPSPSAVEIRAAFLQLSELLFGRLGPYFATHTQLDSFLKIEFPDQETIDRIRPILARPTQRHYFFQNLAHPGWLAPMATAGQFVNIPELIDLEDGTSRAQPWPEGEYLKRMASVEPEQVADILVKIPKTIRNPIVWDAVVRSAAVLPAHLADQLTEHIENALKTAPPFWFPMHVAMLVHTLASSKCEGAFRLAASLLWFNSLPALETRESISVSKRFRSPRETGWVLARIDSYTLGEFLKDALSALEEFNPEKTIELLSEKLSRAVWLVENVEGDKSSYLRSHTSWCLTLDDVERDDDVRAQFAVALTGVARRIASQDTEQAIKVLTILGNYDHEIFKRIKIIVISNVGVLAQEYLDEVISDPQMLDSPCSVREYAALLRSQFNYASPRAQRLFLYNLERGPAPEQVSNKLTAYQLESTGEVIREIVSDWQSRRLKWFHDHIPELLRPVVEHLGIEAESPSEHDRALNEEGFYSSGVIDRGESSPLSTAQMAEMSSENLVSYLETWRPSRENRMEGPSIEGLERALAQYTAEHPDTASTIVSRLISSSILPGYVSALLRGFGEAVEKGHAIPWDEALNLASFVVEQADYIERELDEAGLAIQWHWASEEAARLIEKGCSGNHIPALSSDQVWFILGKALHSPATWATSDTSEDFSTFYSVLSAGLNSLSGHFVEALIDAALWEYRRTHPAGSEEAIEESSSVVPRLIPLVEEVLSHNERAGIAAQAVFGRYIPQLLLMARAWTLNSLERLFDGGVTSPTTRPIWGAYIMHPSLYQSVFSDLRPWYVIAANATEGTSDSQDGEWSLSRQLAVHVSVAVTHGWVSIGDGDKLVESTFSNASVDDRTHAYWNVFRGWSDSDSPIEQELVRRLVHFWEWRLDQLEISTNESAQAEEASGLGWLLDTPYIPAVDAVRLGLRTVVLAGGSLVTRGATLWTRLAKLAEAEAVGAYEIAECLVNKTLSQDYPHLPFQDVAPVIRQALNSDNENIKDRATRLIHTLGDRGMFEYGVLLKSQV
jgi:hypothetical protein